jgi:HAD superfamily hydrolase (TIGR01459 family)
MTPNISPNLLTIASPFKAILLDAYGVFWAGGTEGIYPNSSLIMEQLVREGKIVGILSNSTQPAEKEISKLSRFGLMQGKHYHFLITSGEVARQIFQEEILPFPIRYHRYWLYGEPHPHYSSPHLLFDQTNYLPTTTLENADFIYIGVPHINGKDQTQINDFKSSVEALIPTNLPMVCANPDRYAHEGTPPQLVIRQGSIAALYEEKGGYVYYIGKPSSLAYQAALKQFSNFNIFNKKAILMVGDTPETDCRGAKTMEIPCALITQTGIFAEKVKQSSLNEAIDQLVSQDYPNFFIEKFA